jgi:IclR family transcriptional regulator, KDG regulon repressor
MHYNSTGDVCDNVAYHSAMSNRSLFLLWVLLSKSMKPPNPDKQRKVIGSVDRALDILDLFDNRHAELGNAEIARLLDLPVGTAAGLIYTLKVRGYLAQNPNNRKYHLGFKLAERTRVLFDQLDLRRVALPHLEQLREWSQESVNLGIQDDHSVVYIERMFGNHSLGIRSELGKHAPMHSTALGKAILAFRSAEEIQRFVSNCKFEPVTRYTIQEASAFLADLALTRQRGFGVDDEENEIGGRCVAAPIFDSSSLAIAAVSVSVPVQRLPADRVAEFGRALQSTAQQISRDLGYSPA